MFHLQELVDLFCFDVCQRDLSLGHALYHHRALSPYRHVKVTGDEVLFAQ
jgi:hypothetical protein